MKPDIILTTKIFARTQERLEKEFACHKLYEAGDRPAFLKEMSARVRGLATFGAGGADATNVVEGTVASLVFLGNIVDCAVTVAGVPLQVQLVPPVSLRSGDRVTLRLPVQACVAMRP